MRWIANACSRRAHPPADGKCVPPAARGQTRSLGSDSVFG